MTRKVSDVLDIMRIGLGRRNQNDPDSSDETFLRYLNDFISLIMPNDTKLFESFGTLSFTINQTTTTATGGIINGAINLDTLGFNDSFINYSQEAFISLLDPIAGSISWNQLPIYQDPGEFYLNWGINNENILIKGYPTAMLFYGNEFVFRTIPNVAYLIKIYGYTKNKDFPDPNVNIPFDYWLRYVAYGAMVNYARDFRYEAQARAMIEATFKSEKKQLLTHAHNQMKMSRCMPRF